jgi:hypothetical protein
MDCKSSPLASPKIVAIATDKYLTPKTAFNDKLLPAGTKTMYGQDLSFGFRGDSPDNMNVGSNEADLKAKMDKLLVSFASNDKAGMARKLFTAFQSKKTAVEFYEDTDLSKAANVHSNVQYFVKAALGDPRSNTSVAGKTRIHQALAAAGWDINKLIAPTDLGVPAFNKGNKTFGSEDFGNGLGVMINGVQHVYVVATHYKYEPSENKYCITLRFYLYDVFGLDDDDLKEYGASSDSWLSSSAAIGITAWWQLQHQYGYAPLVTRIVLEGTFEVSTK